MPAQKRIKKMDCYGKFYQKTQHCNECQLNQYCREAADPPLLNEYRGEFNEKITDKIEKTSEPIDTPQRMYSYDEMLQVIGFMLQMDEQTLLMLEEKINNPDISLAKIAKKRKIIRQAVHKYLKAKCESIPEIAAIMFNRRHRKKNHSEYCSENLTQERTRFSPALS